MLRLRGDKAWHYSQDGARTLCGKLQISVQHTKRRYNVTCQVCLQKMSKPADKGTK